MSELYAARGFPLYAATYSLRAPASAVFLITKLLQRLQKYYSMPKKDDSFVTMLAMRFFPAIMRIVTGQKNRNGEKK